jgi:mycothiol synthase
VRDDQYARIQALEADGFACQAQVAEDPWRKAFLTRSASMPIASCLLPEGMLIRPLAGPAEVDAYVALHRSAFESTNMTSVWRSRVLRRAEYLPDLDLVAVTAEGRLAAFCIGWFDAAGPQGRPSGQIEPIGVHADFRQRGLGRAILSEALRRLHQHGAEQVYVESDETDDGAFVFYQSVGFRVAQRVLVYRKDYG